MSLRASNSNSYPYARAIPAAIPSIAAVRHASSWSSWLGLGSKNETAPLSESHPEAQSSSAAAAQASQTPQTPQTPPAESVKEAVTEASSTDTPSPAPEPAQFSNLDTITLDNLDLSKPDLSHIQEGIGYLKALGIEYGYGPTSIIEWTLEHLHIYGGLPWWGAIAATAVLARVLMFPLFLRMSDYQAREKALSSITKGVREKMDKARLEGNQDLMLQYFQQSLAIRRRAGLKFRDGFYGVIAQSVVGYCGFKLLRACSTLPVPGFTEGGFLWVRDLTMTDGYLILPLVMAGTMHLVVRLGGDAGAASQLPGGMRNIMLWVLPAFIAVFMSFQPAALCVWFSSTGLLGITQGQLLKRPAVRDFFGLAPLYEPTKEESGGGIMDSVLKQYGFAPKEEQTKAETPAAKGNAKYMHPTYQSPNLNRNSKPNTIDTTLVSPNPAGTSATTSEMIQPGQSADKKGVFEKVSDQWNNLKQRARDQQARSAKTPQQLKKDEREAFKRMAEKYEQQHRQRKDDR